MRVSTVLCLRPHCSLHPTTGPRPNQAVLARLVELCIAIARQSHVTLMQPKQLAICLGPNLVSSAVPDPRPVVDFLPLLSTLMTHRAGVFGAVAAAAEQPSSPAPQPTSIGWYQNQQDEKESEAGASGSGVGGARPLGSPPKTEAVEALDLSGVGDDIAPKKKKKDREREKAAAAAGTSAVTSPSVTFANSRAGAPDQMLQREEQQRRAAGTCGGQVSVQS